MSIKGSLDEVKLLLGNEAIARGALEAGVQLAAGYPGTPSSEIIETLSEVANEYNFYVEWSTNEMVAFGVAAGASLVGGRALFACKNAGLNVVMDLFMTLPYTGVRGGLVLIVADDPGAWYSSNEQDSRFAAAYAEIPIFEPSSQQEAKDMTKESFNLSEKLGLPVLVRSCTRLSHGSGDVILGNINTVKNKLKFSKHWKIPYRWNVYGPPGPVSKHQWQKNKFQPMNEYSEKTSFNIFYPSKESSKIGIVTSGMAANYTIEGLIDLNKKQEINLLILGMPYPIPIKQSSILLNKCDKILCVEEGEALIEKQLHTLANQIGVNTKIFGKITGDYIPLVDELNPDKVLHSLADFLEIQVDDVEKTRKNMKEKLSEIIAQRSSSWCAGCPHIGSFWALKKALPANKVNIINTGIGCYEMSGYGIAATTIQPDTEDESKRWHSNTPYEMTDTLYVMGSETTLSQGQYQVGYQDGKIVSVLGDSSFFHTNQAPIVNSVYNKAEQLILVLDNFWTCMTGHQPNPATGLSAMGEKTFVPSIEKICEAYGVEFVECVDSYDLENTIKTIKQALEHKGGPSVIISRRVCALQRSRELRRQRIKPPIYEVNEKCTGCKQCVYLGCPAIGFDLERTNATGKKGAAFIDPLICVGCGLCDQFDVCRFYAHNKLGEGDF